MNQYREFQFSWLVFGIFIPVQLLMTFLYVNDIGDRPMSTQGFWGITALLFVTVLLFHGMETTVDDRTIKMSFGIGLIRKRIAIERIKSIEIVSTPWYYGYGIRLIPNGWLYNARGPHGVELRFVDRNRVIRIGTKDPAQLKKEIERRLPVGDSGPIGVPTR